jgi:hypothetical protein
MQHKCPVPLQREVLAVMLCLSLAGGAAAQQRAGPAPAQLRGLSTGEATALIGRLRAAQAMLKGGGKSLYFELLSGAPASYPMTGVAPRDAFLRMRFEEAFLIERIATDNPLWQPYKLALAPDRPGQPVWHVEVVLGSEGQIDRVTMLYKPPAPF